MRGKLFPRVELFPKRGCGLGRLCSSAVLPMAHDAMEATLSLPWGAACYTLRSMLYPWEGFSVPCSSTMTSVCPTLQSPQPCSCPPHLPSPSTRCTGVFLPEVYHLLVEHKTSLAEGLCEGAAAGCVADLGAPGPLPAVPTRQRAGAGYRGELGVLPVPGRGWRCCWHEALGVSLTPAPPPASARRGAGAGAQVPGRG